MHPILFKKGFLIFVLVIVALIIGIIGLGIILPYLLSAKSSIDVFIGIAIFLGIIITEITLGYIINLTINSYLRIKEIITQ